MIRSPTHPAIPTDGHAQDTLIESRDVSRRFGATQALRKVSLQVRKGEIHALLGPNGAGKTTLLRVLSGLVEPGEGEVRILGMPSRALPARRTRMLFGLVPPGYRAFYLRLSGLENLVFFGRLYGLSRAAARRKALELLEEVGLAHAARGRVAVYSEGMYKRLAVARALLTDPAILLVDEATGGLDPEGSRQVRHLVKAAAQRGAGVLWTTQRLDEIRGFADRVTLLGSGEVRFVGTVAELMAQSLSRTFLLHLRNGNGHRGTVFRAAQKVLRSVGAITLDGGPDGEHFRVALRDGVILGDALASLTASGIQVLACREERSQIEEAFLHLTMGSRP